MDKHWSLILRVIVLLIAIAITIMLALNLSWIISLMLISTLIVYILHPLSLYLQTKFRLKHGLATVLVFVLFLLFCISVFSLLIPVIIYEAVELAESFPHYAERFQEYLTWFSQQTINLEIESEAKDYLINLSENLHQAVEYLAEASLSLLSGTVDFFLVLFLVFYLLYDFQTVRTRLISIVPLEKRPLAEELLEIVDTNVGTFIRGSLVRCLIVGIATGLVLYFAGMPYSLLLGLLAGIFNFILYLGPYIAAVPAVLLSFSPLTPSPLVVIIIYVVIQIMDGMLIAPVVLGRAVKLRPITVIVAILAGGSLAGLLGMILAVPVAGMIKNLIDLVLRGSAYQEVG